MKLIKRFSRLLVTGERGSVLIIVVVLAVVLFGMAALTVDVGGLYSARRQMVNAADSAALAGAQEFMYANSNAEVEEYAKGFAVKNYDCEATAEALNNYTIRVETVNEVEFSFAKIFGLSKSDVPADATAIIGVINEMGGLIPIHMQWDLFDKLAKEGEGSEHNFVEFHHEKETPGNWGWVYFDWSENSKKTADYLRDGYPDPLPIGYGSDNKSLASNTGANIIGAETSDKNDTVKSILDYYEKNEF